jgi:hypothetical protein
MLQFLDFCALYNGVFIIPRSNVASNIPSKSTAQAIVSSSSNDGINLNAVVFLGLITGL